MHVVQYDVVITVVVALPTHDEHGRVRVRKTVVGAVTVGGVIVNVLVTLADTVVTMTGVEREV